MEPMPGRPQILAALTVCAVLALAGCAAPTRSACAGLTYKDYGLSREEYGACAKAQVAALDQMHEALTVLGDASQSKQERTRAKGACFRASAALGKLRGEAGGADKLVRLAWSDRSLNRFNSDVEAAREAYAMYCYYGLAGPDVVAIDSSHASAKAYAAKLP